MNERCECGMDPHDSSCELGRRERLRKKIRAAARKLTDDQLVECAEDVASKIEELVFCGAIDTDIRKGASFEVEEVLRKCADRIRELSRWQVVTDEYIRKLNLANKELEELRLNLRNYRLVRK
jgi:predicted naringenin-chalcone synthase